MLASLRTSFLRPTRPWVVAANPRCFSLSVPRLENAEPAEVSPPSANTERAAPEDIHHDNFVIKKGEDPRYVQFLRGPGKQYRHAHRPKNWLGGDVPFPLNPTFKPPTPVSERLRSMIWELFISNPNANSVRNLAERFGLSMKRVDAILRLKGVEQYWIEKKPIQNGFVAGMERILGVAEAASKVRQQMPEGAEMLGSDTTKADSDYDAFGNDEARHRYQRLFWEPHDETASPILPRVLEEARAAHQQRKLLREKHKSDPDLLGDRDLAPGLLDSEPLVPKEHVVERENRPTVKFVDVGGKFIDVRDRRRRMAEGVRRSRLRKNRQLGKTASLETAELVA